MEVLLAKGVKLSDYLQTSLLLCLAASCEDAQMSALDPGRGENQKAILDLLIHHGLPLDPYDRVMMLGQTLKHHHVTPHLAQAMYEQGARLEDLPPDQVQEALRPDPLLSWRSDQGMTMNPLLLEWLLNKIIEEGLESLVPPERKPQLDAMKKAASLVKAGEHVTDHTPRAAEKMSSTLATVHTASSTSSATSPFHTRLK